jgi:uncharacterized membrane protein YjdF
MKCLMQIIDLIGIKLILIYDTISDATDLIMWMDVIPIVDQLIGRRKTRIKK